MKKILHLDVTRDEGLPQDWSRHLLMTTEENKQNKEHLIIWLHST